MTNTVLLSNQTFTSADVINGPVDSNGSYKIYVSPKQSVANSITSLEVIVKYSNSTPVPGQEITNYSFNTVVETEDSAGEWHPIHAQIAEWRPSSSQTEQTHILTYGPHIMNFDASSPMDTDVGGDVISRDHHKQGILPDDFRVLVMYSEKRFGDPGQFQGIDLSVSFNTYAV